MKATKLAHFFDCMRRAEVCFDVTDLDGQSFMDYYGAEGDGAEEERKGTFLSVYVIDNSLNQDTLLDAVKEYMDKDVEIYKFTTLYTLEEDDLIYIIKITD